MSERKQIPLDPERRIKDIEECEYATLSGMRTVSISEDEVMVAMDLDRKLNGFDTGHGGAIFSLADQAFAISVNKGQLPQVAMSASIKYLKPATGPLTAIARIIREDDRTSTCRVDILQGEVKVAEFEGIGYKLKRR